MILIRIILVSLSLAGFGSAVAGTAEPKTTNWRLKLSTDIQKLPPIDSLIEPHEASIPKAQEKVDELWNRLKEILVEKVPASFFSNPPFAGEVCVTVVLNQKLSMKSLSSRDVSRAADVAHTILDDGRYPADDGEAQRQKEAEALRGKAKEYEFVGIRIVLKDVAGREVLNTWCQADINGKVKVKKCAPEIINAMRHVAAHSSV